MTGELLAFAGVMALGQFSPGPDMLLLTRTALAQGRRAGWWMTAGITTGLCVHGAVAIGGMAWLLSRGGWIAVAMKWAAALYLGWLGCRLLVAAFAALRTGLRYGEGGLRDGRSPYVRGLLCNLLNPKVVLFFAGVVAPFLAGERPGWWPAALWGTIVVEGMVLWGLWVALLQWPPLKKGYLRAAPGLDAVFGLGLLAVAVLILTR